MEKTAVSGQDARREKKALLKICLIALFAALIAGGTFISIPVGPVPIVLQNLFALLSGLILGPFLGSGAVALYLLAGILGAPVFSGFTGGITRLAGPTGGFLIGYLLMALAAGLIAGAPGTDVPGTKVTEGKTSRGRLIMAVIIGLLVVYIPGVAWLKIQTGSDWAKAFMLGCAPFLPGDALKGVAAVLIAPRLRKTVFDHLYE